MPDKGGKAARKSDDITRTPGRSKTMEVTPNAEKASEREQDRAKKLKQDKKNNLTTSSNILVMVLKSQPLWLQGLQSTQ